MKAVHFQEDILLLRGNAVDVLRTLPTSSTQGCVTSPPYFRLRDYGQPGQLGQEATPQEVYRVLDRRGSLWLNLGDTYYGGPPDEQPRDAASVRRQPLVEKKCERCGTPFKGKPGRRFCTAGCGGSLNRKRSGFERPKCLLGLPWRVTAALVETGWILRNDVVWFKPNAQPTHVRDRLACCHEHLFHFVKDGTYQDGRKYDGAYLYHDEVMNGVGDVWTLNTEPTGTGHPASYPPGLIERCILACSNAGDVVLDPFAGTATTGLVARQHGRRFVGVDINEDYLELARQRLQVVV